jgi:hypothetical protein
MSDSMVVEESDCEPYAAEEETAKYRNLKIGENIPPVEDMSLKERSEARALADHMANSYRAQVKELRSLLLSLPPDDPYRERLTPEKIHESTSEASPYVFNCSIEDFSWTALQNINANNHDAAVIIWKALKRAAREDLAGGVFAAKAALAGETPAQFATFHDL